MPAITKLVKNTIGIINNANQQLIIIYLFRLLKCYYSVNYLINQFSNLLENQYIRRIKPLIVLIMIPKEKELKLIKIYMYICDVYESSLKFYYQKFSNNNHPFAKEYLLSWFLDLSSSYQAFNYRLILMPEAIRELVWLLIHSNLKIVAV